MLEKTASYPDERSLNGQRIYNKTLVNSGSRVKQFAVLIGLTWRNTCFQLACVIGCWFMLFHEASGSERPLIIDINTEYPVVPEGNFRVYSSMDDLSANEFLREHKRGRLTREKDKFSLGYSNKIFWVLLDVQNQHDETFDMALEVNNPFIDRVHCYRLKRNGATDLLGKGGDRMKFEERTEHNRRYIFRDKVNPKETGRYLLKVDKRNASVSFPIRIWDRGSFADFDLKQNIANGGITVTLVFIAFLSLLSAFLLKNRLFLFYGLYVLFLAALIFSALGYSFQFIYPESKELNQYCRPVLGLIMFFLLLNFFREFVDLRQHYPLLNRVINWIMGPMGSLMVLWFILNGLFYDLAQSLIIPALTILFSADLLFISGIVVLIVLLWKKAYPRPQIFLGAFGIPILFFMMLIFDEFGWMTVKADLWVHPLVAGSFIEVMVLSVAMLGILTGLVGSRNALLVQNQHMNERVELKDLNTIKLKNNELINVEGIMFLSSSGHYVEFHLENDQYPLLDRITMKEAQKQLNNGQFIRIHRNFIVNLAYVNAVYHNRLILEDGTELKVSRTYKGQVKERINSYYGLV